MKVTIEKTKSEVINLYTREGVLTRRIAELWMRLHKVVEGVDVLKTKLLELDRMFLELSQDFGYFSDALYKQEKEVQSAGLATSKTLKEGQKLPKIQWEKKASRKKKAK